MLCHNRYCFVILVLFVKLSEPKRNGEILKSSWYYYYYYYYYCYFSSYRDVSVFKSTDPFMSLWLVTLLSFMKIAFVTGMLSVWMQVYSRISVENVVVILRLMVFAMKICFYIYFL